MPAPTTANLIAYACQIAAIIAIGAGLPVALRLRSPRGRLFYWRTLLAVCIALPLIQPLVPPPAGRLEPAVARMAAAPATVAGVPGEAPSPPVADARRPAAWPWNRILIVVVLAGIAARMAWLLVGLAMLGRLRRLSALLAPRPPSVDDACLLTGADAEFRVARAVTRPVTFGTLRPVVVVPGEFASFDEPEQVAVACHELVHVRRRDWLHTIADEIVRSVFWFHPALWWLLDQIHLTAEQVVDQEVVAITGARQPYLAALVRLASPAPRLSLRPAALFIRRSHLRERVTLLLKEVSMSRPRLAASFLAMAIALVVSGRLVVSAFPLQGTVPAQPPGPAQALQPGVASAPAPTVQQQSGQVQGALRPGEPVPQPAQARPAKGAQVRIHNVRPVYPPEAAAIGVKGPVILTFTIDPAGTVTDVKVLKGDVTLAQAAVDAVQQWRYQPLPAPAIATVAVNVGDYPLPAETSQSVRVGGKLQPPAKIKDVRPVYPDPAKEAKVQGVTIIEATIGPSGDVIEGRVLRSIPQLDVAALDAVMRWKFTPTLLNGVAVPVVMTCTVNFTLDNTPKATGVEGGVQGGVPGGVVGGGVVGGIVEGKGTGTGRGVAGGVGGGTGAGVGGGVAGDSAPVRIGGNIAPPTRTKYVAPTYPEVASAARVQGVVIVELKINKEGKVEDAKILRSIPLLDEAALEAVRQWEFSPTLVNGVPVPVIMTATVNFTLQ